MMVAMEANDLEMLQREVQRRLGGCLVQVQLVERLMKRMLALRSVGGTIEEIENQLATRHLDYKTNTLGTLVKEFLTAYVLSEGREAPAIPEPKDLTTPVFHMRVGLQLPEDRMLDLNESLARLVAVRNDAVHHLVDLFPLWTVDGCQQASTYLDEFSKLIGKHSKQLNEWAERHDRSRKEIAGYFQSPDFLDNLIDGIRPDGQVEWAVAGIVNALSEAGNHLAKEGWTRLIDAIAWIQKERPEQIPSRYACSSYRQVIHESRAFEVQKRIDVVGGSTDVWYRAFG